MHNEWNYLIYVYDRSVKGLAPQAPEAQLDRQAFLQLAKQQAVSGVIACALRSAPFCPEEFRLQYRKTAVSICVKNKQRQEAVMQTLCKMEAEGLHPVVLKGFDLARYYAIPESRSTADADLLLPPQEEEKTYALLAANGFQITPRKKTEHHGKASRADTGTLELHTRLWSDRTAQTLFGEKAEKILSPTAFRRVPFAGGEISVLTAPDALLYLTAHFVRHFIEPGAGLRQAYDVALYYEKNKAEIDAALFRSQLREFGFDGLLSAVLTLFVRCGCFAEEDFPGLELADEAAVKAISDDLCAYGANGAALDRSEGVWDYFCAHKAPKTAGAALQITGLRLNDRLQAVFPKAEKLEDRCPYLIGRHWLYPVAWVDRGVQALTDRERRRTAVQALSMKPAAPNSSSPDAEQRTALLRSVGLLK